MSFWREFGGLEVNVHGSGITRGRVPFRFDPSEGDRFPRIGDEDMTDVWSLAFGRALVPIGWIGDRFTLAIDELGIVHTLEGWAARCGQGDEAVEGLVLGVMPDGDLPLPPPSIAVCPA